MSASFGKHTRTHACTVAHVLKSTTRTLTCTAVLCFSYILFDRSANLHQKPNPIGSHLQKNSIYDILIRVRRNLYASTKAFLQNIAALKVAQQFKWSNSVRLVKHDEDDDTSFFSSILRTFQEKTLDFDWPQKMVDQTFLTTPIRWPRNQRPWCSVKILFISLYVRETKIPALNAFYDCSEMKASKNGQCCR